MKRLAILLLILAAIGGIGFLVWWLSPSRWIGMIKKRYGVKNPSIYHWDPAQWKTLSLADLQELYRTGWSRYGTLNTNT